MDIRTLREGIQERMAQAEADKEQHQRELERLDAIVTSLKTYLANVEAFAGMEVPTLPDPEVPPLAPRSPSDILIPYVRTNPGLSVEGAYQRLVEAGHDFGESNRSRVASNALARARLKIDKEPRIEEV